MEAGTRRSSPQAVGALDFTPNGSSGFSVSRKLQCPPQPFHAVVARRRYSSRRACSEGALHDELIESILEFLFFRDEPAWRFVRCLLLSGCHEETRMMILWLFPFNRVVSKQVCT